VNSDSVTLPRDTNQARGLGQFALDFLGGRLGDAGMAVLRQVERFHRDSIACGVSALAAHANAPTLLRREAMRYRCPAGEGARCFGSTASVQPEKAVVANCSAVREWDSNGTNFGYNPARGNTKGEFGHNDFYPVAVAAAQLSHSDGHRTLRAMILLDEIRGRLAEVFSLKEHKIDHVVHGAIASAVVFAALLGATVDQIESAVGLVVAHYIPFRAIRHGHQLSDSKGASAALSAEMAVLSARRAMDGFVGPADIFRNAEAIFSFFEPPAESDHSPFDLCLSSAGEDFAVMGMHFKLGLYEHQSAGAIQGLIDLLATYPALMADPDSLLAIEITIYEPAFHIIADPAKRNPTTRQSADHSLVYIVATLLRKAIEQKRSGWRELMLMPADYSDSALRHPLTRSLMDRMQLRHGGKSFDDHYPDGIPTTLAIDHAELGHLSSGLVMYPEGHARANTGKLDELLEHKFRALAGPAVSDVAALERRFSNLDQRTPDEIAGLYDFEIQGD
jgi:2-methylcitrate dehydratase